MKHGFRLKKKTIKSRRGASATEHKKRRSKPRKRSRKRYRKNKRTNPLKQRTGNTLSERHQNLEVKNAIVQFMINQIVDELQKKGIYSEQEVKEIYSKTYQYWKNDLDGLGNPFAALDLKLMQNPVQEPTDSYHSAEKVEWSSFVSRFKDEMKAMKRDLLRQKLQEVKEQLLPIETGFKDAD